MERLIDTSGKSALYDVCWYVPLKEKLMYRAFLCRPSDCLMASSTKPSGYPFCQITPHRKRNSYSIVLSAQIFRALWTKQYIRFRLCFRPHETTEVNIPVVPCSFPLYGQVYGVIHSTPRASIQTCHFSFSFFWSVNRTFRRALLNVCAVWYSNYRLPRKCYRQHVCRVQTVQSMIIIRYF